MMFEYYIVVNKPVPIYNEPGITGKIINAYPVGTKFGVVKIDAGWMMTDSATYVFQDDNVMTYKKYKIEHANDLIETESLDPKLPKQFKKGLRALGGAVTVADAVVIKGEGVKDVNNGNTVPNEWVGQVRVVTDIDSDGNVTIMDTTSNKQYTVSASDLQIFNGNEYEDASSVATAAASTINSITDYANELVDGAFIPAMSNFDQIGITDLRQIYGMPYQFLPWADNRVTSSSGDAQSATSEYGMIGRKFGQKIVSRAPILILQAGVPEFMRGFSEKEETTMWKALGEVGKLGSSDLEQMANTPGKYYSLRLQTQTYFDGVNEMAHAMANLLGIGSVDWELPNGTHGTLSEINWFEASENPNTGFYSGSGLFYGGSVPFYINSEPQINESISNGTTRSALDQKMNELGRMASEIQFYMGGFTNHTGVNITSMNDTIANSDQSVGGLMDSIIENVQVLMVGGRMAFPEIWADSQFSRSYTVTIKLDSPDCDNLSLFMNIYLPLACILGFVFPRSIGNNNYVSPFLVRAYYKSMFHIDMGIITGCNITKGDVGAWTQNGLPTQVTVQLEIKDLFNVISLATGVLGGSITSNPGQMDYIANMCGINIDTPNLQRTMTLWWMINNPLGIAQRTIQGLWNHAAINSYQRFNDLLNTTFGGNRA